MKDPNKKYVLFRNPQIPKMSLIKARALDESDFEGYEYEREFDEEVEVWVKNKQDE